MTVDILINNLANSLSSWGPIYDTLTFTNTTNGTGNHHPPRRLDSVYRVAFSRSRRPGGLTSAREPVGGPFTPSSQAYTLQNTGGDGHQLDECTNGAGLDDAVRHRPARLAAGASGARSRSRSTRRPTALAAGTYTRHGDVHEHDQRVGQHDPRRHPDCGCAGRSRDHPAGGLTSTGPVGGPFAPSSQAYTLQNTGGQSINWTAVKVQAWTTLSLASGTLAAATATVTVFAQCGRQRAGRRDLQRYGDVHEHDQRVRQRYLPRGLDGNDAGCPLGHAGRRPHIHGPGRRSVHTVEPGLHAPEHGRDGHQLDGREDSDLDVPLRGLGNACPWRLGDGGHPDQQPG